MQFAGWCFIVSLLAELGGVGLIVCEALRMRSLLAKWEQRNPKRNPGGSWRQVLIMNRVMRLLFTARIRVTGAVALLLVGIIAGTVGNFASM